LDARRGRPSLRLSIRQRGAKRVHERAAALEALPGILGHRAPECPVERRWKAGIPLVDGGHGLVHVSRSLGCRGVALVGPPPREQLEGEHTERVAVAGRPGLLASRLLRREVAGGADHRSRHRQRVEAGRAGDAEVGDVHAPLRVEQEVPRLHVAMDDPAGVCGVERAGSLVEPLERLLGRDGPLPQPLLQRAAGEVLHDDEGPAVGLADVEDRHDVGCARKPRRGERLAGEPLPDGRVLCEPLGEDLDRHLPIEHGVERKQDVAHAAVTEPAWVAEAWREHNHRRHGIVAFPALAPDKTAAAKQW
jgi:hypothetical protein